MLRHFLKLTSALLLVLGTGTTNAQSDGIYYAAHHNYRVVEVAEGFLQPWSMAFLPGGDMLVTEKPGRLRIVRDGKLLPEAVAGIPDVHYVGQGGLVDVVLHPNFAENRWVYISYAKPIEDTSTTAIIRGRFENDQLTNVVEIFAAQATGFGHYGGKIAFDGEGYLYLSLGDRQAPSVGVLTEHPAQDPTNHQGVIVRLNEDGSVPDDNPFVGQAGFLPEIWTYGHRSPQGLAIHPETGDLWETEHGPQGGDELNRIEPGNNYGWPVLGYGVNYGSSGSPIHEGIGRDEMTSPTQLWVPSIATSGLMIYTGDKFPMWHGSIFSGALVGEQLARLHMSDDYREVIVEEELAYNLGRIRDVRQGLDGYIYIAVSDGNGGGRGDFVETSIMRLEPID